METDVGHLDEGAIAGAAALLSAASHDDDVAPLVECVRLYEELVAGMRERSG